MITPAEAQSKRTQISKAVTEKLMALVEPHALACEKSIDEHLIRSGVAHFSESSIKLSDEARDLIDENINTVSSIRKTFIVKVLGNLETKYRTAGWNTIVKQVFDKNTWEIVVKEKELDPG